jgi:hypothetical protein
MDRNPFMGAMQEETIAFLTRNFPSETPLAGGAAKVKELDREFLDRYVSQVGESVAKRQGLNLLEADWVATEEALYYISPRVGQGFRYPWTDIAEISIVKKRWRFATLAIQLPQQVVTLKAGLTSATVLTKLYRVKSAEISRVHRDEDR